MKKRTCLFIVCIGFLLGTMTPSIPKAAAAEKTVSQEYVERMGAGWNLGNTFDGFDTNGDKGEESWGNPRVTQELIQTVKEKGFDSIRMPFTTVMRIGDASTDYQIDSAFLDRYEEVVRYALEQDLLVMINVHHDSWEWLANWQGDKEAEEYQKFVRIWEQLSERFKDYDERVMFESINEPQFYGADDGTAIGYLTTLNDTFYHIVRNSGGNNTERMLVLPTLLTDNIQPRMDALQQQILSLEDSHLIATIHYYSEWVYSANLGITRFDEVLWDDVSARTSLMDVFDRAAATFTEMGIGLVIGEYGLLGYDSGEDVNQVGETLKFLEFINHYAQEKGIALMLWDNGQHLNRYSYTWNQSRFGAMVESSIQGRSSYAEGLDTIFINKGMENKDIEIPLTLNGNELTAIYYGDRELPAGTDYFAGESTLILPSSFIDELRTAYPEPYTGELAELRFIFSGGADWLQKIVQYETAYLGEASGTKTEGLIIPVDFNGDIVEKAESHDREGNVVSNNSWWSYLQYKYEFEGDVEAGTLQLTPAYLQMLSDGLYQLTFSFYSGEKIEYQLSVEENEVVGVQMTEVSVPGEPDEPDKPEESDESTNPNEPDESVEPTEPDETESGLVENPEETESGLVEDSEDESAQPVVPAPNQNSSEKDTTEKESQASDQEKSSSEGESESGSEKAGKLPDTGIDRSSSLANNIAVTLILSGMGIILLRFAAAKKQG